MKASDIVWAPEFVATGAHCWHKAPVEHLVTNHMDIECCWCAKTQCVSGAALPGHGSNSLDTVFALPPPEKCPERPI